MVEIGAPRGLFTLADDDDAPVALLSAGVGATPVLAMLASLAGNGTGVRCGGSTARARAPSTPSRRRRAATVATLPGARSHIRYSRPDADPTATTTPRAM